MMLEQLTIRGRLLAFGAVALLGLVLTAALAVGHLGSLSARSIADADRTTHWVVALAKLDNAESAFKTQVQEWKNILLRGHEPADFAKHAKAFDNEAARVAAELKLSRENLAGAGSEMTAKIDALLAVHAELGSRYRQALSAFDRSRPDAGQQVDKAVRGMDRAAAKGFGEAAEAIEQAVVEQLQQQRADAENRAQQVRRELLATLVVLAVVIVAIALWITASITRPLDRAVAVATALAEGRLGVAVDTRGRSETARLMQAMQAMIARLGQIIGEVRGSADSLADASAQVAMTAQNLSRSSSEQAASVEETTASMTEMSASISRTADNVGRTDAAAAGAADQAAAGGEAVTRTVEAMRRIAGTIGIVNDIAYQTNLLALNAAIEAARAGQHGKGFAVVAAEVRKLAERSQAAAADIGEVARDSVALAESTGSLLSDLVPAIRQTSDLVREIDALSRQQRAGVEQINAAVGELNRATQQNASTSEELAATAEQLGGQAGQLQQLVAYFRLDDEARAAAG